MPTLALGMILKDEVNELDNILTSYRKYFDEVHITITNESSRKELKEVCKKHNANYSYFQWCDDFAKARNFNKSQIKSDYIFRIDADDTISNPEKIREVFEDAAEADVSILYCFYVYSKDEHGACNAAHYRETIYKNTDNLYWNKAIHENLLPKSVAGHRVLLDDRIVINHNIDQQHAYQSAIRNIKYLLKEYNENPESPDPRTVAYLGRMFMGVGDFDKALFFLQKHIEHSGWDEDRYVSWCGLSEILKQQGKHKQAIAAANEALQERPDYPDAYLKLHDIYFELKEWDKAIEWGKLGLAKPMPKTFMLLDPSSYSYRPTLSMAFCYFQKSDFESAIKLFRIAQRQAPNLDFIKENEKLFVGAVENKRYLDHFMWLFKYMMDKDEKKAIQLLDTIPHEMRECEALMSLRNKHKPIKEWDDKSIVIFCGTSAEPWSPQSVATGIGGSEEAVINISQSFTKLGYKVTVYSNCLGQEGDYDGVEYAHYTEFNSRDKFNILVSWRMNIFVFGIGAKRRIVWLHDLPINIDLTKNGVDNFDKIIVLSEYHKSLLLGRVPDEKVFVSTNGINEFDFVGLSSDGKNPHRIIYASSYNRGLETILKAWPKIKQEVPDAEIHCYYGWQVYDEFVANGLVKEDGFKQRMLTLFKQDGVYEHGRIGHKELLTEYTKAGVYAYPSNYDGEINCIAYTKAVACGCFPVTNDYAVMGERNKHGYVGKTDDKFIDLLIDALKENHNLPVNFEYIKENSWDVVAKDWHESTFVLR